MTDIIYKYLIKPLYKTKHDGEGDPYETGTRHASDQPLVFIDPTKIDLVKFKEANDKLAIESQAALGKTLPEGASDIEKRAYFKELEAKAPEIWNRYSESIASLIRPQIDAASPELSNRFSVQDLVELTHGVLTSGPAAGYIPEAGVCLVVKPTTDKVFFIAEWLKDAGFDEKHILPTMTPEQLEIIKEAVGRHEGEHCNQQDLKGGGLYETFVREYQSDLKLLELIREKDPSLAQQIADTRILRGANGDAHHAGLMFGSDPSKIPTKEQFNAILNLQKEMNSAVAQQSGLSIADATNLRTNDPQAYADFVKSAIDSGKFPAPVFMALSPKEKKELVAAEMGITTAELDTLGEEKVADIVKAYDKLEASGAFLVDVSDKNPHLKTAAQAYVDATQRLFIPDTTPAPSAAPVTTPAAPPPPEPPIPTMDVEPPAAASAVAATTPFVGPPEPTSEERIKLTSFAEHKADAKAEIESIMINAVMAQRDISESEAKELMINDKASFITAVEDALLAGKVDTTFTIARTQPEIDAIWVKYTGQSKDGAYETNPDKAYAIETALLNSDAYIYKYENPAVLKVVQEQINAHHLENRTGPYAPPPAAPIEPKAEPRALEPSAVPSSLPSSPPKIHTSSAEPIVIPKHGRAEIVASDVSDQIKIGGLSAAAYFQSFAHPELAQQRIEEQALTRQFALTSPPPAMPSNQLLGAKA